MAAQANLETHGYIHSDNPNIVFLGLTTTFDVTFNVEGSSGGRLTVVVYTPKGENPGWTARSIAQNLSMDTCPLLS